MDSTPTPPDAQLTPREYVRELRISDQKRLLVEGPTDRELFRRLLQQVAPGYQRFLAIDTAERVCAASEAGEPQAVGNRARVLRVCELAAASPAADQVVGFVDREFDDFTFDPSLGDRHPGDVVAGRVVRARGHSVENYLFDFRAFGDRMREYVPAEDVEEALALFERVFPDAVRVACALGLTGYHHPDERWLKRLVTSVGWQSLAVDGDGLRLVVEHWGRELVRQGEQSERVRTAERDYLRWWEVVRPADYGVVRWLCHGHIGFEVIWAAFGRCVYHTCKRLTGDEREKLADEVRTDRRIKTGLRFRAIVDQWIRHALQGRLDCPRVIFGMLGLAEPAVTPVEGG